MASSASKKVLALEIRASKFGFAAFEGAATLLDWGVRWFGDGPLDLTVADRIATLLEFYRPQVVVVRDRERNSAVEKRRLARIVRVIRKATEKNSARFTMLSSRKLKAHFRSYGPTTKHSIASFVAQMFEEISWKLPNRRKPYESESPAMVVFDAVATGVAYFDNLGSLTDRNV